MKCFTHATTNSGICKPMRQNDFAHYNYMELKNALIIIKLLINPNGY